MATQGAGRPTRHAIVKTPPGGVEPSEWRAQRPLTKKNPLPSYTREGVRLVCGKQKK